MKTTVLFRMIVLVAMVFAGIANTTVKAQGNNFITNEEKVDDLVVSKVIYNRQIKKFPTEKQNVSLKHILT